MSIGINHAKCLKANLALLPGDKCGLNALSLHLTNKRNFFNDIMIWLEETFVRKQDKYIFVNCHGDSILHHSFKFSTHIFPVELPNEKFQDAKPIFFSSEN